MHNHPLPAGAGKLRAAAFAWMLAAPLSLGFLVSCGGGGSSPAPVTPTPTIGTHPAAATAAEGATATFTVVASGSGTLSYQWLRNGVTLSGATSASYTTPATTYAADNGASFTVQVWSGNSAKATSSAAVLTVTPVAPVIGTQPANATVTDGQPATFSVAVSAGSAPLSYQWYKGNTAIVSGGNTASYTTGNTLYQYDNNTTYKVEVTNAAGQKVMSDVVTLSVTPIAPSISTQPSSAAVADGQQATFTVAATGTLPITYQWKKNGSNATEPSATYATFGTMADYGTNNGASYTCVVTNGAGQTVTSDAATLTVTPVAPTIVYAPANRTVLDGGNATFSVTASGTAPLSYQWFRNDVDLGAGARNSSYTTPNAVYSSDNNAQYHCVVTNQVTSVPSSKGTLTVTPIAPTFSTDATAQTATDGTAATFSVAATGTAPLSYQWYRNDVAITTGATSASYTTPATVYASDNNAQYHCVVTNGASQTATSTKVALTVTPIAPTISVHPLPATVTDGQTAGFSVTASGTAPLSYQWKKDAVNAAGATATTASYTTPATEWQSYNNAKYTCIVTNGAGQTVTSNEAALTVTPVAPAFSTPAAPQTVNDGQAATFSVVATGTAPLSYQWYRNDVAIATGGTGQSYTTPATVYADDNGAQFHCVVTNGPGATATGGKVALTVTPVAPSITTQPANRTVGVGQTATFSVVATGTAPLGYQWYKDNVSLGASAQGASYTTPATVVEDNGAIFKVVVTNGVGQTVTSDNAALTVSLFAITTQPQSKTVTAPDGNTFTVGATGNGLSYVWKKNGTAINGATTSSYTVSATDLHETSATYTVTVTDESNATLTSDPATLTVIAPKAVYAGDPVPTTSRPQYGADKSYYTTAPSDATGSFRFGYDVAMLNPLWSSACWFSSAPWAFDRPNSYPTDPRFPGSLSDGDYSGTGYSRSHMVGFADLRDVYGADAGRSTMYMTNMGPMTQQLNGVFWSALESIGTQTLPGTFGRVWNYTGPIFSTQLVPPVGAKNIPIPTAWYKILVRETSPGNPKVLAIIVPHSYTISSGTTAAVNITNADSWKFVTTVDRVQALTGLNFFPSPASSLPANFTSVVDVTGWGAGLEQGPSKPNVHMIQPSWDSTFTHKHNSTNVVTTINTTTANAGDLVPFVAQVTPDPDPIASTTWNFGDGSPTSSALSTTHSYSAAGNYTVTFTAVDNAGHTSSISRIVTIAAAVGNTPPTISAIADKTSGVNADTTVNFTVTDDSTAVGSILVAASSNNTSLLPNPIVVTNNAGACTLTLSPAVDAEGTAIITVTATDQESASSTRTFNYTVTANQPPTITGLADTSITKNGTKTVNFTVADAETAAGLLTVTAHSSDATVIPDTLTVTNTNGACTLDLVPVADKTGTTQVTVRVTDGGGKYTEQIILVTVLAPSVTDTFDTLPSGLTANSYKTGDYTYTETGHTWGFVNVATGNASNGDRVSTGYALRIANTATIQPGQTTPYASATLKTPHPGGCSTLSLKHASYGTDSVTWSLWYSTDGTTWIQVGGTGNTLTTTSTLTEQTFTVNVNAPIYFQIRNETSGITGTYKKRLNIDDFVISNY